MFASAVLLAAAVPAAAQTLRADGATAPAVQSGFGGGVAIVDRDILVAEAQGGHMAGVIHLFRRTPQGTWVERGQVSASDATLGDGFGRAMAVDGRTLLAGSQGDSGRGAVYAFARQASGEWQETGRLTSGGLAADAQYGSVVGLAGDMAMVGAWGVRDRTGVVYLYRRSGTGWTLADSLMASDAAEGQRFGASIEMNREWALIGAPGQDSAAGSVYVFKYDAGTRGWKDAGQISAGDRIPGGRFGSVMVLHGTTAIIGAPLANNFIGAAYAFELDTAAGSWRERTKFQPFDGARQYRYGSGIAFEGNEVWISAPAAGGFQGRVYQIHRDSAGGEWNVSRKLEIPDLQRGDFAGGSLALAGDLAVVGIQGDDFGEGTALIFERSRTGGWTPKSKILSRSKGFDAVAGREVKCADGMATGFDCSNVDLLSFLPVSDLGGARGVRVNDIWGWTDPQTGKEYALVGRVDGTAFVDVSNPANPKYLGSLPKTEAAFPAIWRDIKTYKNHAYIVADGAGDHGMQVFDLTQLRSVRNAPVTFRETAHYDRIHSAHNIVINEETGFAYAVGSSSGGETCGGGLHMIDIREPENPKFAGCFSDPSTGRSRTGYTHDAQCVVYHGPDTEHQGREVCFGANETALSIADVTDKSNPVALSVATYPNVGYSHQGWLTDDQKYFLMDDELDELAGSVPGTRTLIWDVSDLDDPVLLKEYISKNRSSDHNLYVLGHYVYQSNYTSGLRILDIKDINNPVDAGYFDTVPYGEDAPGFGGSWSNYPFFKSGIVIVTSGREGLFVVKKRETAPIP
ncbi:MAG: choice-of-anchor B family protein [Gemmatimonadales bacterium]